MRYLYNSTFLLATLFVVILSSCGSDDPEIPNEEELITTLEFTLTPEGGGSSVVFSFTDLDGDGGDAPVIVNGTLEDSTSYTGTLVLLNETEDPAEDITEEVEEEDAEHQFFFTVSSGLNLEVTYDDMDDNGNPVGIASIVETLEASSGTLTILLRHEPDKDAEGVADGDPSNAGGETDIQVTFDVTIE